MLKGYCFSVALASWKFVVSSFVEPLEKEQEPPLAELVFGSEPEQN